MGVQKEVICNQNKSDRSDQARAEARTETWVCMRELQNSDEKEAEMKKLESGDWDRTRSL